MSQTPHFKVKIFRTGEFRISDLVSSFRACFQIRNPKSEIRNSPSPAAQQLNNTKHWITGGQKDQSIDAVARVTRDCADQEQERSQQR